MDYKAFLKDLTDLGPRCAEKELQAAKIIKNYLSSINISFISQIFDSEVPVCTKAELIVDNKKIDCLGSSLVSGKIPNGEYLISHFGFTGDSPYNIAYSPVTDNISVVDHFKVPSLTISRKDIIKIIMAKEVKGIIEIKRTRIKTENILVGNTEDPKYIVFAHFDSIIGPGAVDNAGSVTAMMSCIENNENLLTTTLFNFSGNEEMAYDDYQLSGYGFRVFEQKYGNLLEKAEKIVVMDGLGVGEPIFTQNGLDWVLQLKMLDKIREKVFWLQNDQASVLQYFHTHSDKDEIIEEQYLSQAEDALRQKLTGG